MPSSSLLKNSGFKPCVDADSSCAPVVNRAKTDRSLHELPREKYRSARSFSLLFDSLLDIVEYEMIASSHHQSWIFYLPWLSKRLCSKTICWIPSISSWMIPSWSNGCAIA